MLEDVHGEFAFGVPEPVNCNVEPPTVMLCAPVIVGTAFTLTVIAVRGLSHGLTINVDDKLNPISFAEIVPLTNAAPFAYSLLFPHK